jgi:CheY-like chemotaxis protein
LSLPATDRAELAVRDEPVTTQHAPSGTALLVDDEDLVRTSTSEMLTDLGFIVTEASSAAQALELLGQGHPPSILVTDHLMPGMTGGALIEAARSVTPDLRALLISGYAESEGIPTGIPRLSKPFRLADLELAIDAVMQRR